MLKVWGAAKEIEIMFQSGKKKALWGFSINMFIHMVYTMTVKKKELCFIMLSFTFLPNLTEKGWILALK